VIGNSTEIKNAVLFDNVAAPHYNYIGDSIVGNHAHLGAGVILSNLKSDKSNITVKGVKSYPTCLRKMGAIIGDKSELGCGCVLNPGTVIGKNSIVYPLTSVRGVVPECSIVKSNTKTVPKI
jgi:NDP-sugar pyrophosphorylase family protein